MKEIIRKTDELLELLDLDERIVKVQKYKQKLLENKDLLSKIEKLRDLNIYSDEYKKIKLELFRDADFVEFKHYENEINLLIMQINQKLKQLTDKGGCYYENN